MPLSLHSNILMATVRVYIDGGWSEKSSKHLSACQPNVKAQEKYCDLALTRHRYFHLNLGNEQQNSLSL